MLVLHGYAEVLLKILEVNISGVSSHKPLVLFALCKPKCQLVFVVNVKRYIISNVSETTEYS